MSDLDLERAIENDDDSELDAALVDGTVDALIEFFDPIDEISRDYSW